MIQIGQYNKLKVSELSQFGAFLDGGNLGNILLPNRYTEDDLKPGMEIRVFIYLDSEDRLVATTEKPIARVGDFAFLKVSAVTNVGAFLDWGLAKELLVPFREQRVRMQEGEKHLVYIYLDDATKRIVASAKIDKFLDNTSPKYEPGDKVELIISGETEIGFKAIINQTHSGLLYRNETNEQLKTGAHIPGYIKRIREDDKIDLSLSPLGMQAIQDNSSLLLSRLDQNNGLLPLTDQSSPEEIKLLLGISKKAFKKAVGTLYKQGKITLEKDGIQKVK
ncbi:CvfB family protein [Marinilabilia rubra]|uniref:GntR family transcriptional regulator n=1 Tax=Marinilabilia rubra TaxID=2162893 RepID=A0A2U2B7Q0_9BACT|nr:S1-like domain-containing RNA-binding protein [Marinilabilia rubra]PWD99111.1 GntR family transcriptional regulator [Marinilabilia rubra]